MKRFVYLLVLFSFMFWVTGCSEDGLTASEDASIEEILLGKAGNKNPGPDANYFDSNGNLCLINYGWQDTGTPLELWMGVGNEDAGTKVGEVTFDDDCVVIDLTKAEGVYDLTAIHMEFVADYDEFPQTKKGNPINGKFMYNFDSAAKLNTIRMSPSVYKICGISFSELGAIHIDAIPGVGYPIPDFENLFPTEMVTMSVMNYWSPEPDDGERGNARPAYFKLNIGEDGGILAGEHEGWCIDYNADITRLQEYSAHVFSSYESLPTELTDKINEENLDKINYLLNTFADGDYIQKVNEDCSPDGIETVMITSGDMQRAIWYFLEDEAFDSHYLGPWSTIGTNAVICAVEANGAGFMPGCGEYILFIAIPKEGDVLKQTVVGKFPVPCREPGMGSGTAWADGKYGIGFLGSNWATYFGTGCAD